MAIQPAELGSAVREQPLEHPALDRLRQRLLSETDAVASVITSYDRMHHRHSRS